MKHAVSRIRWLSPEEGGRSTLPPRGYATVALFEGHDDVEEAWSLVVYPEEVRGREERVLVCFLVEDAPEEWLRAGSRFALTELARVVARGNVECAFEVEPVA